MIGLSYNIEFTENILRFAFFFLQMDKKAIDNRANQRNPNYSLGQGKGTGYHGTGTKQDLDNHSNQMNPNNPLYKK